MLFKRRRERNREKEKEKRKKGHRNYIKTKPKKIIGTKLITNTKKLKLKIQSRIWNFRYTMLYKRRERKRGKKSHKNYKNKYVHN